MGTELDNLIGAAKSGDIATMKTLLAAAPALINARAESGETPLIAALYRAQHGAVEWLVGAGAPIDIFAAAALGKVEVLERDLAAVNTYSYDGWTPLHLSAFFGQEEAAIRLMGAGAELNALSRNALRNTPLHAAVAGGHVSVSLLLIDAGADVNTPDAGGHTPFHIAAEAGYVPVVKALLARGADAHVVDAEDRTPLARAAARGHEEIVDLINVTE
jgi:ankyrin repeat protein